MKTYDIMFDDLTPEAQEELCKAFDTTPDDENWDTIPIAVVEREEEETDLCLVCGKEYDKKVEVVNGIDYIHYTAASHTVCNYRP